MPRQLKVYVACALTHAPQEFRDQVVEFQNKLEAEGFEVLRFQGLLGSTPLGVYIYDLQQVLVSDLVVHLLEFPSDGGGMEAQTAHLFRVPSLMLARRSAQISRMNNGLCEFARSAGEVPYAWFERCDDFLTDGVVRVHLTVQVLKSMGVLPRPESPEARLNEGLRYVERFYRQLTIPKVAVNDAAQ